MYRRAELDLGSTNLPTFLPPTCMTPWWETQFFARDIFYQFLFATGCHQTNVPGSIPPKSGFFSNSWGANCRKKSEKGGRKKKKKNGRSSNWGSNNRLGKLSICFKPVWQVCVVLLMTYFIHPHSPPTVEKIK